MKRRYGFCILLVTIVLYAVYFSANHIFAPVWEKASFVRLFNGTAATPMQYRVLIPWLAKILVPLIQHIPYVSNVNRLQFLFEFPSTLLLLISFYALVRFLLLSYCKNLSADTRFLVASCSVYLLMLVLPFHFLAQKTHLFYYPSDIPSVLFFVLGMWTIHAKRWSAYYPIFILATLNRETSCFLTIYYSLFAFRNESLRRIICHVSLQTTIWVLIKLVLYYLYAGNTDPDYANIGGLFKMTLFQNLTHGWAKTIVLLPSVYGFLWIPLLLFSSYISPTRFRRAMLVILIFHILMLIPGEVYELRIYAEMIPVVIVGLVVGVCNYLSNNALHHYAPQAARG